MKNLFYVLCVSLTFLTTAINAQKITGVIRDSTQKPVEFATIMLMHSPDSVFIKGAVTEGDGSYVFENVVAGKYYINASMIGLKNFSTLPFTVSEKDVTLNAITLKSLENELKTVTISTKKPTIEVKADRLVFNVAESLSATGLNGLELLRKSPGVQIDKDENVRFKGKSNVAIWINGKPSPLSGADLAAFLKGLNSNDIEAIELISNPSAKFDAAANGGIINIKLKKNTKLGTNGNVSLGVQQGITPKGDFAINLNHRDANLNVFGSYSTSAGIYHNTMTWNNRIGDTLYAQNNTQANSNYNHSAKIGADYTVNKFTTIGVLVNGTYSENGFDSYSTTTIGRPSLNSIDSVLVATNTNKGTNKNINYNLNYKFADTTGHELTIDADYGAFRNDGSSYLPNLYYADANLSKVLSSNIYRTNTPVNIDIMSFKTDYEQNFWKGKLGFGAKFSDVTTDNKLNAFKILNGSEEVDVNRTNYFTYKEKILAGYVNFNRKFGKKFSAQLGLRAENTSSMGDLVALKATNTKNVDTTYLNLFPSAAFGYAFNDNNALNFTYRYSIDRPSYQSLNPFEYQLNELLFEKGNPFLRPQYTHSFEFGYVFKQSVNFNFGYSKTNDYFTDITDQEFDSNLNKTRFFVTQKNLAAKDHYYVSLGTPLPIKKWWNGYLNTWFNYDKLNANFGDNKTVSLTIPNFGFYAENTFTLGKGWSTELSGFYSLNDNWGIFRNRPLGVANIAVQKKFMDGDASVKLGFDDILGTSGWNVYETTLGNLTAGGKGTYEGRRLKLNFNYRFGNKNVQSARNRKTSLEEEAKRVK